MRYIYGKIRFELIIITNTGGTFYQGYLNVTRLILALVATFGSAFTPNTIITRVATATYVWGFVNVGEGKSLFRGKFRYG